MSTSHDADARCSVCQTALAQRDAEFSDTGAIICRSCRSAAQEMKTRHVEEFRPGLLARWWPSREGQPSLGRRVRNGVVGLLFLVGSVTALYGAGANAYSAARVGAGSTADGTVTHVSEYRYGDRATVKFVVDGQERTCSVLESDLQPDLDPGDPVRVRFTLDDGRLECMADGSVGGTWALAGGLLCCMAPAFFLVGLGSLAAAWSGS